MSVFFFPLSRLKGLSLIGCAVFLVFVCYFLCGDVARAVVSGAPP